MTGDMTREAKLTLAVPNRNGALYLEHTLASLERNRPYVRWWLQDSCSTDNSAEIAQRFAGPDDRIVVEKDSGQTSGLNRAFKNMGGDIVGFINSDDLLADGAAETILETFDKDPELDLIYGQVEWIDSQGRSEGFHAGSISSLADILNVYEVWWKQKHWVQPEVFYRRSLWERVGPFDETYDLAFDYDYWVRCFRQGIKIKRVPQVLAKFRRHPEQKSTAGAEAAGEIRSILAKALDSGDLGFVDNLFMRNRLGYDSYRSGNGKSHTNSFWYALSRHPWWLALPEVRSRLAKSGKALGF